MTLNIENEYSGENAAFFNELPDYEEVAESVALRTLEIENCPYEAEIGLLLTGDSEIRELNRRFRSLDQSTDVLSFPMIEYGEPSRFEGFDKEADLFDPDTGELMLGDIVISVDHLVKQAGDYGHGIKREFAFLTAHSMLHLLGYDHMTDSGRSLMEEKQDEILNSLGIVR